MSYSGEMGNHSGSITAGGTAQTAMGQYPTRKYLLIQNPATAGEILYVDFGRTAVSDGTSIEIVAGGSLEYESGYVPSDSVSVLAATTGHKFVAKEG